jgi:hypothetical protein
LGLGAETLKITAGGYLQERAFTYNGPEIRLMKMRRIFLTFLLAAVWQAAAAQELPRPTYANSVVVSIEHGVYDSAEVDSIKASIPFGLYAWPSFSLTTLTVALDWNAALSGADAGIQAFKDSVNGLIASAKAKNVKLHIVIVSGIARGLSVYNAAKVEDVRNAMWYNDNRLSAENPVQDPTLLDRKVFATFSRYARKLQANREAKGRAAIAFFKQKMDAEPGTLIAVSGWGESEMNFHRIQLDRSLQDFFGDYSPFAVLEFRDWIQHTGLYDDATGRYRGEGYAGGGTRYQGASGLNQFNADFGVIPAFTTWDLRYFHWGLNDDYDHVPEDYVNPDPKKIPFSTYLHGGMMPTNGTAYKPGGFDPPRTMQPGDAFYDLWQAFRETMVRNHILDIARWVNEAGIDRGHWFSHQIPADYLFGTHPGMPPTSLNARYYSSASPLRTADVSPYLSAGATIYDVKFPGEIFYRTTQYVLPDIAALSPDWAIMEYDAETYPPGLNVTQSQVSVLFNEYLRVYNHRAHFINFWRWIDPDGGHQIKGMNKETALREFVRRIRDKARSTDPNLVFTPPRVVGLSGEYRLTQSGFAAAQAVGVHLQVTGKIWSDESWEWKTWGDFRHFEVFRSTSANFPADQAHWIGETTEYAYTDTTAPYGGVYYYKYRAENSKGVRGPESNEVMVNATGGNIAILSLDKTILTFGGEEGKPSAVVQKVLVRNAGAPGTILHWLAFDDAGWLLVSPASGTGDGFLETRVDASGLGQGTYSGRITVQDPNAANSPQFIDVTLRVYAPGEDAPPFGVFETPPEDGQTRAASFAVTGWTLDDVEVTKLEIKRNAHPTDAPGNIQADGLVYVGEAVFVKGARPDVEQAFPNYPHNNRAGWGYMLLSNFFPNRGNGTFTLHAIAHDSSGHQAEIGQKTVYLDNENSDLPFGAIDTPAQGGTASGAAFVNFGWALTPPPNFIPYDGSTIQVWVDSLPLGHPNYGHYREDIATLFPEYLNSGGAIGYFVLNTTAYPNGTHTIVWSVRDSAGNEGGIGSRYFEIYNAGAGAASGGGPLKAVHPAAYGFDPSGRLAVDAPGPREIEVQELGLVEIRLQGKGGRSYIGWGAGEDRELPIGSSLDPKTGIFRWIPGPGFLGRHILHFAVTDGFAKSVPLEIAVRIVPRNPHRPERLAFSK